jgi:hypothetical protein
MTSNSTPHILLRLPLIQLFSTILFHYDLLSVLNMYIMTYSLSAWGVADPLSLLIAYD